MERQERDRLIKHFKCLLAPLGFDCIEVETDNNGAILRIYIDKPSGITLDDCALASKALTEHESFDKDFPDDFHLEVSSPGLARPLRDPEHFRKILGAQASVRLINPVEDRKFGKGRVLSVSPEDSVTLETSRGLWTFRTCDLDRASLIVDLKTSVEDPAW